MAIETRDLTTLTPAQVSALRSSQLEALTTDEIVALKAGSAAAIETAQVALFTSGRQGGLFYAAPNGMKLHEFFGVSERTVRRWEAAGADLTSAPRLLAFLRNLARPSESVGLRLEDPDCERRLVSLLNADEPEDSKALAGDPGFEPFSTLSAAKLRKTMLEVERLEIQNAQARGELINRAEVREAGVQIGAILSAECQALVNDLTGQIAGQSEEELRPKLQGRIDLLLDRVKAKLNEST